MLPSKTGTMVSVWYSIFSHADVLAFFSSRGSCECHPLTQFLTQLSIKGFKFNTWVPGHVLIAALPVQVVTKERERFPSSMTRVSDHASRLLIMQLPPLTSQLCPSRHSVTSTWSSRAALFSALL